MLKRNKYLQKEKELEHSHLFWKILSEYIPARDQEAAAHHLVNELIDAGMDDESLLDMCKGNATLRRAVMDHLGEDESDEDDYEEL